MSEKSWRRHVRPVLTLQRVERRWPVAVKAAVTILVLLGVAQAAGRPALGLLANLGAFTVLYAPTSAGRYRLRLMLVVAGGLVASVAAGALTAGSAPLTVVGLAATAAVATFVCAALRIGPPGAFFFVLVHGVAGLAVAHGTAPGTVVGAAAAGAAVAVAVGMSDLLLDPSRPERLGVEDAETAMTRFEVETDPERLESVRHGASHALLVAWTVVADAGSGSRWVDRLWAVQDRYSAANARVAGSALGLANVLENDVAGEALDDAEADLTTPSDPSPSLARRVGADQIRDTSLGRPGGPHLLARALRRPSEVLLVTVRVAVAALLAGLISVALGVEHVYWTVAFATLVLHQGGTRDAQTVRGLQRLLGTFAGLGAFALLTWIGPTGWVLVFVVVALQFTVEMLVVRNYALAVIAITPLALTIASSAAGHRPAGPLIAERAADTVIGVAVALLVLRLVGRDTSVTLLRGYARRVVLAVDAVLADLAAGRVETRPAREHRRMLHHELLESDEMARRAHADDPSRVAPYRDMERALADLGYVVLGMAWHPDARAARHLSEEAREPLARILAHSVRGDRSAGDIHADVLAVRRILTEHARRAGASG